MANETEKRPLPKDSIEQKTFDVSRLADAFKRPNDAPANSDTPEPTPPAKEK
ncbi:hypothetical protein [Phyllobacterium phragmitis]|uniref:hypothetical protein n=1 Tax=Phyllobacterium phragmitis TaxID=2670329 RepID=UPI001304A760|nr:hypothetical protein [Phyllobacterium phragmitis]